MFGDRFGFLLKSAMVREAYMYSAYTRTSSRLFLLPFPLILSFFVRPLLERLGARCCVAALLRRARAACRLCPRPGPDKEHPVDAATVTASAVPRWHWPSSSPCSFVRPCLSDWGSVSFTPIE